MNYLYLLINITAISVPFLAAYHPKIQFFKNHYTFFLSIAISGLFFILWDVWFVKMEVWGFSLFYTLGFGLFGLPIEEWLFFLCIPYASLFLHIHLHKFRYLSSFAIGRRFLTPFSLVLLSCVITVGLFNYDRSYTFVNAVVFVCSYIVTWWKFREELKMFLSSFLVILIPFALVNGILTGSGIHEAVVWYNNEENLGIRLGTIPIEDVFYAFSMLIIPLIIYTQLKRKVTQFS